MRARLLTSWTGVVVLLGSASLAHAQAAATAAPDSDAVPIYVAAGIAPLVGVGEVCEHNGDSIGCTGVGFVSGGLAAHAQLWAPFQVGFRAAVGFEPGSRSTVESNGFDLVETKLTRRLWLLNLEARYEPDANGGFWTGLELGLGAMQDVKSRDDAARSTSDSKTQWAPLAGLDIGYGFSLGEGIAFAPGLRIMYMAFTEPDTIVDGSITYGQLFFAGLLLDLRFTL